MSAIGLIKQMAMVVLVCVAFSQWAVAEPSGDLIIFHAGSLSVPLEEIGKGFVQQYPRVNILRKGGGSTKMARLISEVGKPADIMASADFVVIDKVLVPDHADWNVRFATNQPVLCYTDKSKFAGEIRADNWYEILSRKEAVWGHSDPNLDPCGYHSRMVLQLAEIFYNQPGLYDKLIANRPQANVRPKSVELVALLKTGNMDYAWEYLSVAVQHELKYVKLDDHINLGNYKYDDFYKRAQVQVTGDKPGTFMTQTGQSCTYGITMIKDGPNPEAALAFLDYMPDPQGGLKVPAGMGQPPFILPAGFPLRRCMRRFPGA